MADQDEEISEEDVGADGDRRGPRKRKISGRSLVLFVVLPLLLLGGGGGGAYVMGVFDMAGADAEPEVVRMPKSFYDMPEMLVNLSERDGTRSLYLKLRVSLELEGERAKMAVEPVLPRIIDMFHVYLRELRPSDLDGSAGIFRLKEELIRRVNLEITPDEVSDVLFKEIIIQ